MAYRRGATGVEVGRIQGRLSKLGLYLGPVDGVFGGGTESAVIAYQRGERLSPDGAVGPQTWARLFPGTTLPAPSLASAPLAERCLALTAAFETGLPFPGCYSAVAGDFDGAGLSFGALQWNLGSGTLQPLLRGTECDRQGLLDEVFHCHAHELRHVLAASRRDQLAWARSLQTRRGRIAEPWLGLFRALGGRPECQRAQRKAAAALYRRARAACPAFGLRSQRAAALMFDIQVQNGGIRKRLRECILAEIAALPARPPEEAELERLLVVATRRAEACRPRWVDDVRRRKLVVAEGRGSLHGALYDLEEQYGITLAEA